MTEGIILAGGYSSRAKANKMALLYHGKPLILSTIETMRSHVSRIVVVTGHHHGTLKLVLKDAPDVEVIRNDDYDMGMFSSVKVGLAHTTEDVFIIPGDVPTVNPGTYGALLKGEGDIRVPSYGEKKGHPIFIDRTLRGDIMKSDVEKTHLKAFRDAHGYRTVPVDDPGILIDIDTKEDYHRMTNEGKGEKKP